MLDHGYIQIYTGDGKGKTTASLGLALRALGHNWKVLIIQFTKGDQGTSYGEIASSYKFKNNLDVFQYGMDRIIYSHNVCMEDYKEAKKGWDKAKEAIKSGKYQLIILDEINICIDLGMIKVADSGALFRTTDKIKADFPDIPAYTEYSQLIEHIKRFKTEF